MKRCPPYGLTTTSLFLSGSALLLAACTATNNGYHSAVNGVSDGYHGVVNGVSDGYHYTSGAVSDGYHTTKAGVKEAAGHADNLLDATKEDTYASMDHLATWIRPTPPPKPPLPVAASYCYSALQDVLCYRQPMPGWEHRLVSYQGTGAPPPPPAMMQPLPVRQADMGMAPEKRVASSKPVFDKIPNNDTKASDADKAIDPNSPTLVDQTQEQLPNPANAPQL